jgi:hypothetical protein
MSRRLKLAAALAAAATLAWSQSEEWQVLERGPAEFHFVRVEYTDLAGMNRRFGRGWWRQDWPDAEIHFAQGIRRLTQIDVGEGIHMPLTDERIFDFPWIYATQTGYWDLSDEEVAGLREYLLRGGFLMTDDFYGEAQWTVFAQAMARVFPERPILEVPEDDSTLHVFYDLDQRIQIPGLRHLRGGWIEPQDSGPHWRGIYDDEGRMMVAANYNMDIGDAWEHADWVEYPEPMTALAYRFGINYIVYAMTH